MDALLSREYRLAGYLARNYAHVRAIRAKTVCAVCGAQPIEWHRPAHKHAPHMRISALTSKGVSPARLDAEIALCTPLCRTCHRRADRATHCPNGHERTAANTYPSKQGPRCKQCSKNRAREYRERVR